MVLLPPLPLSVPVVSLYMGGGVLAPVGKNERRKQPFMEEGKTVSRHSKSVIHNLFLDPGTLSESYEPPTCPQENIFCIIFLTL